MRVIQVFSSDKSFVDAKLVRKNSCQGGSESQLRNVLVFIQMSRNNLVETQWFDDSQQDFMSLFLFLDEWLCSAANGDEIEALGQRFDIDLCVFAINLTYYQSLAHYISDAIFVVLRL